MGLKHVDQFSTTLAETIIDSDLSFDLTDASGLGTISAGDYIECTIDDGAGNFETIYITAVTTNTITSTRGEAGTTAAGWASGSTIECRISSAGIDGKEPLQGIATRNTRGGDGAMDSLTSAVDCTAYGYNALTGLTSSTGKSSAFGAYALSTHSNQSVSSCNAFGYESLKVLAGGSDNCAFGYQSGVALTSGGWNSFFGNLSGAGITTANSNVAIGYSALGAGSTHGNCVAVGRNSMNFSGTSVNQTAVGYGSGSAGNHNSYFGYDAGGAAVTTGRDYNTGIGYESLRWRLGNANTAIGYQAGKTSGSAGSNNVFIGYQSGASATTGDNNIIIGSTADKSAATAANEATIGNASIATLRCQQTSITALSDKRDKKDIKDIPYGLNIINSVRPVEFAWNMRDGSVIDKKEAGFIAQELWEVEKQFDCEWLEMVLKNNPEKLEAAPNKLFPYLIKAVQELSQQVKDLQNELKQRTSQ